MACVTFHHGEHGARLFVHRADFGDRTELLAQEPPDRTVVPLLHGDTGFMTEVLDVCSSRNEVVSGPQASDGVVVVAGFRLVVEYVADDMARCHHSGNAAKLVGEKHDFHVLVVHRQEQIGYPNGLRIERSRSHDFADRIGIRPEKLSGIDVTDEVIGSHFRDRHEPMSGIAGDLDDVLETLIDVDHGKLVERNHDFPCSLIAEIQDVLDHAPFGRRESDLFSRDIDNKPEIPLGSHFFAATHALTHHQQEKLYERVEDQVHRLQEEVEDQQSGRQSHGKRVCVCSEERLGDDVAEDQE